MGSGASEAGSAGAAPHARSVGVAPPTRSVDTEPGGRRAEVERLRAAFERLARVDCLPRSPLYARICTAIAGDDEVLAMLLHAPTPQRRPVLLLAAIHDLLLAGIQHPLAPHVPTVAAGRVPSGDPGRLALDLCRERRVEIAELLATRTVQTNEVNRACALRAALAYAVPAGCPLRLVELGASAGLNLLFDRFEYRFAGPRPSAVGPDRADAVACACALAGHDLPALDDSPLVAERIGVDLEPIDILDERAARWLLACIWPDEADRVARLRAALALARRSPPPVVRGDGLALLRELGGPPGETHLVIWHSWVLAYWPSAAQRALADAIDAIGARRDLTWIYLEQASEVPGLPMPVAPDAVHDAGDSALVALSYRGGVRSARRLADAHAHVHEMRWFPGA